MVTELTAGTLKCLNMFLVLEMVSTFLTFKKLFNALTTHLNLQEIWLNAITAAAEQCNAYYINNRWLGGTLTNFNTIKGRVARLKELEEMFATDFIKRFTKKEAALLKKEYDKLEKNLGGIKDMKNIPDVMFIVDINMEQNAVLEAHKLGIPIVAIVDTNCDPEMVDFPIPGNDDAIRACQLIAGRLADAINEGRQSREDELVGEVREASKEEDVEEDEIVSMAEAELDEIPEDEVK